MKAPEGRTEERTGDPVRPYSAPFFLTVTTVTSFSDNVILNDNNLFREYLLEICQIISKEVQQKSGRSEADGCFTSARS